MIKVIDNFNVKNQYVLYDSINNTHIFQSYDTIVCEIKDKIYLNKNAWLSRTTRRYLYKFINYYGDIKIENDKDLQKQIKLKNIILKDFDEC